MVTTWKVTEQVGGGSLFALFKS